MSVPANDELPLRPGPLVVVAHSPDSACRDCLHVGNRDFIASDAHLHRRGSPPASVPVLRVELRAAIVEVAGLDESESPDVARSGGRDAVEREIA